MYSAYGPNPAGPQQPGMPPTAQGHHHHSQPPTPNQQPQQPPMPHGPVQYASAPPPQQQMQGMPPRGYPPHPGTPGSQLQGHLPRPGQQGIGPMTPLTPVALVHGMGMHSGIVASGTGMENGQPVGANVPAATPDVMPPEPESKTANGKTFRLDIAQEPVRARMCGFGDKDRRPITPPPCIRLIVTDENGSECDVSELDTTFFVLSVDLWDISGHKEVNLVRHSATSPSISAATSSSYPPPSAPAFYTSPNTAAQQHAHQVVTGMAVHGGMPGAYGQMPAYGAPHQPGYPPMHHGGPQGHPPPGPDGQGYPGQPNPYYGGHPGMHPGMYPGQPGMMPGMPGGGAHGAMLSPHAAPMDPRSAPSGMFTRNLIGSLAVSANRLTDTGGKVGIWFILQDLSVRTEGTFRLKLNFVDVGDPNRPSCLITQSAPILATTYSDPFHVFSAKKFPGVIESTALSKCFAMQGIKIPIRKDGPTGKVADPEDDPE